MEQQIHVAINHGENIVEVVPKAISQMGNDLHFLRLGGFRFELMLLARISGQNQPRRRTGILQIDRGNIDIDQLPIPPAMPPASSKLGTRARFGKVLAKRGGRFGSH